MLLVKNWHPAADTEQEWKFLEPYIGPTDDSHVDDAVTARAASLTFSGTPTSSHWPLMNVLNFCIRSVLVSYSIIIVFLILFIQLAPALSYP